MSNFPPSLRYAQTHEWARLDDDGHVAVGITDYAQEQLGDVVYVELPDLGQDVQAGGEAAVVESVKAASEIYAPVSGSVVAVNAALADAPELVNQSPYADGWFFRVAPSHPAQLDELLDADSYARACREDEGAMDDAGA